MKKKMFKLPRQIICDASLSLTTRKVAAVLYAYCDSNGYCRKGIRELASLAFCDEKTVMKATDELAAAGLLSIRKSTRYDSEREMVVNDRNTYTLLLAFSQGYGLIPYTLLAASYSALTPAAFVVCLYIFLTAGAKHRAYPSIRRIRSAVGIAKSTVCLALGKLKDFTTLCLIQFCRKANMALSCNSYWTFIPAATTHPAQDRKPATVTTGSLWGFLRTYIVNLSSTVHNNLPLQGVVRFFQHQIRNKITKAINLQKGKTTPRACTCIADTSF